MLLEIFHHVLTNAQIFGYSFLNVHPCRTVRLSLPNWSRTFGIIREGHGTLRYSSMQDLVHLFHGSSQIQDRCTTEPQHNHHSTMNRIRVIYVFCEQQRPNMHHPQFPCPPLYLVSGEPQFQGNLSPRYTGCAIRNARLLKAFKTALVR